MWFLLTMWFLLIWKRGERLGCWARSQSKWVGRALEGTERGSRGQDSRAQRSCSSGQSPRDGETPPSWGTGGTTLTMLPRRLLPRLPVPAQAL